MKNIIIAAKTFEGIDFELPNSQEPVAKIARAAFLIATNTDTTIPDMLGDERVRINFKLINPHLGVEGTFHDALTHGQQIIPVAMTAADQVPSDIYDRLIDRSANRTDLVALYFGLGGSVCRIVIPCLGQEQQACTLATALETRDIMNSF